MTIRRGYIHYALLDKRRPSLVISTDTRNALASNVLVIPCSTSLTGLATHVRVRRGEGGLASASVLKCEQITNLPKDDVDPEPLGLPLSPARIHEVEAAVMRAIGILVPTFE